MKLCIAIKNNLIKKRSVLKKKNKKTPMSSEKISIYIGFTFYFVSIIIYLTIKFIPRRNYAKSKTMS